MFALADDPTIALADRADRTIRGEEFGTVILESVPFRTESVVEEPFPVDEPPADPVSRLEEKLDAALRAIALMQQRIESLDTTLMRVLMR
jgi:hypothetical protein